MSSLILTSCAPSPLDIAMGAGVTLAARADESPLPPDQTLDEKLELIITRAWMNLNKTKFSGLNVISNNGYVILEGDIQKTDEYLYALEIVWAQNGVRGVENRINILNDSRDLKKMKKIIERLKSDAIIKLENLSIEVINNEVFLLGNVENKMHLSRITHHINSVFQARRIVTIINYKNQLVE